MFKVLALSAFCAIAVVHGHPFGGCGGFDPTGSPPTGLPAGGFGGHGGPGGPLGNISQSLSESQQTEAKQLIGEVFAPNSTLTKAEGKAKLDAFVATLSSDLQTQINALKPTGSPPTPTGLTDAASALLAQIQAIKDNDSITFAAEHEQIGALIKAADPTVVAQLPKGPHGGPCGSPPTA